MSKLSRRSLVSSAAALPVLAVPAVASFSPDHPDAELLRHAPELELIAGELEAANAVAEKINTEWKGAFDRAGLLPELWWSEAKAQGMSDSEWWKEHRDRYEKRAALLHDDADQTDEDGATIWDKLNGRLNPLAAKTLAMKATTVDGLRVQARAVALAAPDLWAAGDQERGFLEAVFAFLGVDEMGNAVAA